MAAMDSKLLPTAKVLGELLVDEGGKVTTIIQNHIKWLAIRESSERLLNAPLILLLGLTLPGEDRDTSRSDAVND